MCIIMKRCKSVEVFDIIYGFRSRVVYSYGLIFCQKDRDRIETLINRMIRLGFLPAYAACAARMAEASDASLFKAICNDPSHVLWSLTPPPRNSGGYNLHIRYHNFSLPLKDSFIKMLTDNSL